MAEDRPFTELAKDASNMPVFHEITLCTVEGTELASKDSNGKSDPFFRIGWVVPGHSALLNKKKKDGGLGNLLYQSQVYPKTLTPVDQPNLKLTMDGHETHHLRIEIWDKDPVGGSEWMGSVDLKPLEKWTTCWKQATSWLQFTTDFENASSSVPSGRLFVVRENVVQGAGKGKVTGSLKLSYSTVLPQKCTDEAAKEKKRAQEIQAKKVQETQEKQKAAEKEALLPLIELTDLSGLEKIFSPDFFTEKEAVFNGLPLKQLKDPFSRELTRLLTLMNSTTRDEDVVLLIKLTIILHTQIPSFEIQEQHMELVLNHIKDSQTNNRPGFLNLKDKFEELVFLFRIQRKGYLPPFIVEWQMTQVLTEKEREHFRCILLNNTPYKDSVTLVQDLSFVIPAKDALLRNLPNWNEICTDLLKGFSSWVHQRSERYYQQTKLWVVIRDLLVGLVEGRFKMTSGKTRSHLDLAMQSSAVADLMNSFVNQRQCVPIGPQDMEQLSLMKGMVKRPEGAWYNICAIAHGWSLIKDE